MIFLVILGYTLIAFFQIKKLKKNGYRRDLIAFCFFLTIAVALSLLAALGIKIPSPIKGTHYIMDLLNLHY